MILGFLTVLFFVAGLLLFYRMVRPRWRDVLHGKYRGCTHRSGVLALKPVSKMAPDITHGRALGGNLRLIRPPRRRCSPAPTKRSKPDLDEFCTNKDAAASARLDARVVYHPIAFLKERSPALSARYQANEKSCAMTRQVPWTPGIGSNGRMVPSSSPAIRPVCRLAVLLRTAD